MTDDIEKEASKKQEAWGGEVDYVTMTEDEWIKYICGLDEPEEKYKMKCIKCGYEESVPAWIVGEFAGENKALGKSSEVALECPKCNGAMYRKK